MTRCRHFPLIHEGGSWLAVQGRLLLDREVHECLLLLLDELLESLFHRLDLLGRGLCQILTCFLVLVEESPEFIEVELAGDAALVRLEGRLEDALLGRDVVLLGKLCVESIEVVLELFGISKDLLFESFAFFVLGCCDDAELSFELRI